LIRFSGFKQWNYEKNNGGKKVSHKSNFPYFESTKSNHDCTTFLKKKNTMTIAAETVLREDVIGKV
jgi:hypothetical protein